MNYHKARATHGAVSPFWLEAASCSKLSWGWSGGVWLVQANVRNCRRVFPTVSWHCSPLLPAHPHAILCALLLRLLQLAGAWDFVVEEPYVLDIGDIGNA